MAEDRYREGILGIGGKSQYGRRMNEKSQYGKQTKIGLRRPAQPVSSIGNMHKLSGVCLCILPLCNLTNLGVLVWRTERGVVVTIPLRVG